MASRSDWQARRARMEATRGRSSVLGPRRAPVLRTVLRIAGAATRGARLWQLASLSATKLMVSELDVHCPGLPAALDGFTILHLSDIHLEAMPLFVDQIVGHLSGLRADLAVITGDFQIEEGRSDPALATELTHRLVATIQVRHGIFGCLGNHDSWQVVAPLERIGIRLLINEHATIGTGADALHLVGIDDIHAFYTDEAVRTVRAAPPGFRVLLAHTPEVADIAADAGYGLYLAGHTHGGQICWPGGRPLLTGLDTHHALASGRWRIGSMHGYTNRGLGVGGVPLRLNCPPEIALLRLRSVPD